MKCLTYTYRTVDDTSLSIRKNNNIDLTNQLISDVNSLYEWLNLNKLKLNTAKTKILIYKGASLTSNIVIERQQLSIDIYICKTYNLLGIILDTKLDFKQHIISIQIKLSKIIYMLKKLSIILPKKILYLLYNSLFLPHVLYCLELWGNVYFSNIYEIELLQKKVIRIINKDIFIIRNGTFILSSTNSLFINSNILKLRDLIIYKNILFMHNIFVGNCPKTMNNIFVRIYNKYRYSTFNYTLPYIKHTRYHNSILLSGPKNGMKLLKIHVFQCI